MIPCAVSFIGLLFLLYDMVIFSLNSGKNLRHQTTHTSDNMKFSLATTIALASLTQVLAVPATKKAVAQKCYPLDTTFQLNVPHGSTDLPPINYAGYEWKFPKAAAQGNLVSFFGNFHNNQTTSSQITTVTNSTSVSGGSSMSSATGSANGTTVVSTTFSSGNASR
jgi:hypothetical protein